MKARLKRYEKNQSDTGAAYNRIQSESVEFICITGDRSAKIIDSTGKHKTVRRSSLMDIPQHILYPEIDIVGKRSELDTESWKAACYFD